LLEVSNMNSCVLCTCVSSAKKPNQLKDAELTVRVEVGLKLALAGLAKNLVD